MSIFDEMASGSYQSALQSGGGNIFDQMGSGTYQNLSDFISQYYADKSNKEIADLQSVRGQQLGPSEYNSAYDTEVGFMSPSSGYRGFVSKANTVSQEPNQMAAAIASKNAQLARRDYAMLQQGGTPESIMAMMGQQLPGAGVGYNEMHSQQMKPAGYEWDQASNSWVPQQYFRDAGASEFDRIRELGAGSAVSNYGSLVGGTGEILQRFSPEQGQNPLTQWGKYIQRGGEDISAGVPNATMMERAAGGGIGAATQLPLIGMAGPGALLGTGTVQGYGASKFEDMRRQERGEPVGATASDLKALGMGIVNGLVDRLTGGAMKMTGGAVNRMLGGAAESFGGKALKYTADTLIGAGEKEGGSFLGGQLRGAAGNAAGNVASDIIREFTTGRESSDTRSFATVLRQGAAEGLVSGAAQSLAGAPFHALKGVGDQYVKNRENYRRETTDLGQKMALNQHWIKSGQMYEQLRQAGLPHEEAQAYEASFKQVVDDFANASSDNPSVLKAMPDVPEWLNFSKKSYEKKQQELRSQPLTGEQMDLPFPEKAKPGEQLELPFDGSPPKRPGEAVPQQQDASQSEPKPVAMPEGVVVHYDETRLDLSPEQQYAAGFLRRLGRKVYFYSGKGYGFLNTGDRGTVYLNADKTQGQTYAIKTMAHEMTRSLLNDADRPLFDAAAEALANNPQERQKFMDEYNRNLAQQEGANNQTPEQAHESAVAFAMANAAITRRGLAAIGKSNPTVLQRFKDWVVRSYTGTEDTVEGKKVSSKIVDSWVKMVKELAVKYPDTTKVGINGETTKTSIPVQTPTSIKVQGNTPVAETVPVQVTKPHDFVGQLVRSKAGLGTRSSIFGSVVGGSFEDGKSTYTVQTRSGARYSFDGDELDFLPQRQPKVRQGAKFPASTDPNRVGNEGERPAFPLAEGETPTEFFTSEELKPKGIGGRPAKPAALNVPLVSPGTQPPKQEGFRGSAIDANVKALRAVGRGSNDRRKEALIQAVNGDRGVEQDIIGALKPAIYGIAKQNRGKRQHIDLDDLASEGLHAVVRKIRDRQFWESHSPDNVFGFLKAVAEDQIKRSGLMKGENENAKEATDVMDIKGNREGSLSEPKTVSPSVLKALKIGDSEVVDVPVTADSVGEGTVEPSPDALDPKRALTSPMAKQLLMKQGASLEKMVKPDKDGNERSLISLEPRAQKLSETPHAPTLAISPAGKRIQVYKTADGDVMLRVLNPNVTMEDGKQVIDFDRQMESFRKAGPVVAKQIEAAQNGKGGFQLLTPAEQIADTLARANAPGADKFLFMPAVGERGIRAMGETDKLQIAKDMDAQGLDPERIRFATGFYTGLDGKWRKEVPGRTMQIIDSALNKTKSGFSDFHGKLSDAVSYPELFKLYPELADDHDLNLSINPNLKNFSVGGGYSESLDKFGMPGRIDVKARTVQEAREVLVHELQHAVQKFEGFAKGASPDMFSPGGRFEKFPFDRSVTKPLDTAVQQAKENLRKAKAAMKGLKATDPEFFWKDSELMDAQIELDRANENRRQTLEMAGYKASAGEVESRDQEDRLDYTDQQLADIPPLESQVAKTRANTGMEPHVHWLPSKMVVDPADSKHMILFKQIMNEAIDKYPASPNPDLANPLTGEDARTVLNAVDIGRTASSEPIRKTLKDVYSKADSMIASPDDSEKVRKKIMTAGATKAPMDAYTTAAAHRLLQKEAQDGVAEYAASGNVAKLFQAHQLGAAYRASRSAEGLALRIGQDPELTPHERRVAAIRQALVMPMGKGDALDYTKFQKQMGKVDSALRTLGMSLADVENIDKGAMQDPVKAMHILQQILAARSTFTDKMTELYRNIILSGTRTQVRNFTGNMGNLITELGPVGFTKAALNHAVSEIIGQDWNSNTMGEMPKMWGAVESSLGTAVRNAFKAWSSETPVFDDELGHYDPMKANIAIGGKVGRLVRTPQRTLLAADQFAKTIAGTAQATAEAYRAGRKAGLSGKQLDHFMATELADKGSESWQRGFETANYVAFQEELGRGGRALMALRDAGGPVGKQLFPFITTPINIEKQGMRFTPLAALASFSKVVADGVRYSKNEPMTYIPNRDKWLGDMARQLLGWAAIYLMWDKVGGDNPMISGAAETKYKGASDGQWRTMPPWSVRVGDKTFGYGGIEPFATILGGLVSSVDAAKKYQSGQYTNVGDATSQVIRDQWSQLKDKTFLRTLSDISDALENENKGQAMAVNYASSWMPAIWRSTMESADPIVRDNRDPNVSWSTKIARRMQLSDTVAPPRVDLFGREIKKPFAGESGEFYWRILSPVEQRKQDVLPMDRMMMRWNSLNPDKRWYPEPLDRKISFAGQSLQMNEQEYYTALKASGVMMRMAASQKAWPQDNPTEQHIKVANGMLSSMKGKVQSVMGAALLAKQNGDNAGYKSAMDTLQNIIQTYDQPQAKRAG